MLPNYGDIRSRISEEPTWFDDNGTPRYGEFQPDSMGVYDDCAALIEIECQSCSRRFLVGVSSSDMSRARSAWMTAYLAKDGREPEYPNEDAWLQSISDGYHYGDPPSHGCVGDTMNCIDIRLIQAWRKNPDWQDWEHSFVRVPELERDYELPEWAR